MGVPLLPAPEHELLVQATVAAEPRAAQAWEQLAPSLDITVLPAPLYSLLPLLARRLPEMGIRYDEQPRLDGVRRRTWYQNARTANHVLDVLDVLDSAGVGATVTGGLGVLMYAADLSVRYLPRADVAVSPGQREQVHDALHSAGWQAGPPSRAGALLDMVGRTWTHGDATEVTIWCGDPWPYPGEDAIVPRSVAGMPEAALPVPHAEEVLAFQLTDAPMAPEWSPVRACADVMLLAPHLSQEGWGRLVSRVAERRSAAVAAVVLRYAVARLGLDASEPVLQQLSARQVGLLDRAAATIAPHSQIAAAALRRASSRPAAAQRPSRSADRLRPGSGMRLVRR